MYLINDLLFLIIAILFTFLVLMIAMIDIMFWCIPDHLNYMLLWLGLSFNLIPRFAVVDFWSAVLGAILGYLILWLLSKLFNFFYCKDGIGCGDFKLLAALGAWNGWQMLAFMLFMASMLALLYILINKMYQGYILVAIPFAPFLVLAGWLAFFSHSLIMNSGIFYL